MVNLHCSSSSRKKKNDDTTIVPLRNYAVSSHLLRSYPGLTTLMIHWSSANGGVREVYNGVIDNKINVVAIKRLNSTYKQGGFDLRTEIKMLSKFQHSHTVSLIDYCYI